MCISKDLYIESPIKIGIEHPIVFKEIIFHLCLSMIDISLDLENNVRYTGPRNVKLNNSNERTIGLIYV